MKHDTPSDHPDTHSSRLQTAAIFSLLTITLFVVTLHLIFTGRSVVAQVLQHSGNVLLYNDEWDEAQWAFQEAIHWNPYNHHIYYGLGQSSAYLLQGDQARFAYRVGLKANPNHVPSLIELARLLIHSGDYDEAEELLNRAHASVPHFWRVHQARALLAEGRGDLSGALEEMEQTILLELTPLPMHYMQLGKLQYQTGRYAEAEATAERVLDTNPNVPSMLLLKGRVAAKNNMNKNALILIEEALQRFSTPPYDGAEWTTDRSEAHITLADIHLDTGKYQEAIEELIAVIDAASAGSSLEEQSIRLIDWHRTEQTHLSSLESWNIGKVAVAAGLLEEALQYFKSALDGDLEGQGDSCRLDLARTLRTLERYGEAIDILKQISPSTLESTMELAEIYEAMGKPASARFEYTTLLQMFPVEAHERTDIEKRIQILKGDQ